MIVAMRFHYSESEWTVAMRRIGVFDEELFIQIEVSGSSGILKPDGRLGVVCFKLPGHPEASFGLQEIRNEPGEGGSDSVPQAEYDYRAIVSKDEVDTMVATECSQ
jgi:hypothetical protein